IIQICNYSHCKLVHLSSVPKVTATLDCRQRQAPSMQTLVLLLRAMTGKLSHFNSFSNSE
ncbi:hypothetical protein, partial [Yersinia alsatica]|uniref:hypothetical protein n=1 Tax=Yersinia alsatica TaxID=2890317 RepID=UPI001C979EA9